MVQYITKFTTQSFMKISILQFPGSNCDYDAYHAITKTLGLSSELLWHKDTSLKGADAIIIPGGFSYGDYLRCGAIARFSPIMKAVTDFALAGGKVLGICNGFQILCESGLLPGCLIRNDKLQFRCQHQKLDVEDSTAAFNKNALGDSISIPIAHGEGNYRADEETLQSLEQNKQIFLRYSKDVESPNGSINRIAGIRNKEANIFGMMPHPERAVESIHQSQDGISILKAFIS